LFARFRPEAVRHVQATPFVSQVLTFMEDFGAVPDAVIRDLREAVDEKDSITVPLTIEAGEVVEVVEGPLRGQEAKVTRVLPGAQRVRVLLEFLGNQHEVELSILSVLNERNPREAVF
jgi:transcription antitermination factor NusG